MKFFHRGKDGGEHSTVWGYWLVEIKRLFSVVLLRFEDGSRDAYHSHAFNCFSWVIRGKLVEKHIRYAIGVRLDGPGDVHSASLLPFITRRDTFHKVASVGRTWVLSFRGPWASEWQEYLPEKGRFVTLTNGRRHVDCS